MMIETFSSRWLQTNTYLVACDITRKALLIDPGGNLKAVQEVVSRKGLDVVAIVNTHTHIDHVWGNHRAKQIFGAPLMVHQAEAKRLLRVSPGGWVTGHWLLSPPADRVLNDGDLIEVGSLSFNVIHTPGHSPGGICLRSKKAIFTGDTLFAGGIGRTDLKGGDYDTLVRSIKDRIFVLSDDIRLYPGHGEKTNIENERKYNLFVRLRPEQIDQLLFGPLRKRKHKTENRPADGTEKSQ